MSLEQLLNLLACAALILFGIYSILRPREAAALAHITPNDALGSAEVRISFGGLSLMTGIVPFILGEPVVYQTVGIIYLGALATRMLTLVLDRPQLERSFIMTGVFELAIGLILLLR